MLIHLRDQLLALERIAGLCKGTFVSAEEYDRPSSLLPFAVSRYRADRRPRRSSSGGRASAPGSGMMWTAGFDQVEVKGRFKLATEDFSVPHVVIHSSKG